jgi:hypothetical protein
LGPIADRLQSSVDAFLKARKESVYGPPIRDKEAFAFHPDLDKDKHVIKGKKLPATGVGKETVSSAVGGGRGSGEGDSKDDMTPRRFANFIARMDQWQSGREATLADRQRAATPSFAPNLSLLDSYRRDGRDGRNSPQLRDADVPFLERVDKYISTRVWTIACGQGRTALCCPLVGPVSADC